MNYGRPNLHLEWSREMRRFALILATILPFALVACGGSSKSDKDPSSSSSTAAGGMGMGGSGGSEGGAGGTGGTGGSGPALVDPTYIVDLTLPTPTSPPQNAEVKIYEDVAYGTDPLQRFDIILPKSGTPTPLIIYIHGGGFVSGDKKIQDSPELQQTIAGKVAYASLNYRLLADVDKDGVLKPMTDSKRALQFIRYHAAAFNIDPKRVALMGDSGGAGTSLWIATHDDMAGNGDAVDAMSTRVLAVAPHNTQATYDIKKWENVVFAEYNIDLMAAIKALGAEQRFASFYGMDSIDQFETPEIVAYRKEVNMFLHMSADDPPIHVRNPNTATMAPANQNELFHHGNHAKAIKSEGTAAGISVIMIIPAMGIDESNGQDDWTFLNTIVKQ